MKRKSLSPIDLGLGLCDSIVSHENVFGFYNEAMNMVIYVYQNRNQTLIWHRVYIYHNAWMNWNESTEFIFISKKKNWLTNINVYKVFQHYQLVKLCWSNFDIAFVCVRICILNQIDRSKGRINTFFNYRNSFTTKVASGQKYRFHSHMGSFNSRHCFN